MLKLIRTIFGFEVSMNYIFGLILMGLVVGSRSKDLPRGFITCPRQSNNREQCLSAAVVGAIRLMAHGLRDFGIPSLEPLEIDNMSIGDDNAAAAIRQVYKNVKIYGLTKDLTVQIEPFDVDDLVLHSKTRNSEIKLVADYDIRGRVLLFPIHGNGRATLKMSDVTTEHHIEFERYTKNGEDFFNVKKYTIKLSPEKVHVEFTNLFNGDSSLGDNMNRMLNDNWQSLFRDTKGPFEKTFGNVFQNLANKIFNAVPLTNLFPD